MMAVVGRYDRMFERKKFCDWFYCETHETQVIASLSHGIYFIKVYKTSLCIVHLLCISAWEF